MQYLLFQGEGGATSSHSTYDDDDSDDHDPTHLGYFEPLDSDNSDDSTHHYEVRPHVVLWSFIPPPIYPLPPKLFKTL